MTQPGLDNATLLAQIDDVMKDYDRAKAAAHHDDFSGGLSKPEMQAIATRLMATIVRLAPANSPYVLRAATIKGHHGYEVQNLGGILQALRADIEAGYVQTLMELVHADVFADLLEMADELQSKRYKDAAAVIAGSVLEEHLRKLAGKTGVDIERPDGSPKKADTLNNELSASSAYNKLQQKNVTAWLDLRNKAAHGNYADYDHAQVSALVRDIRDFLIRLPA
jgi:hypothetical protein